MGVEQGERDMWQPFFLTIEVAFLSTMMSFVAGVLLAYFVWRRQHGKAIFDAVLALPMVLPPTAVGFFLLLLFGKQSIIGAFLIEHGIPVVFTFKAAFVVSFPLLYRTVRASFAAIDRDLLGAARTLGVSELHVFFRVLLPLAKEGILAGVILSFARSVGEFGATMMVAGNIPGVTRTMATALYAAVQANDYELAYLWAGSLVALSLGFILLMNVYLLRAYSKT